MDESTRVMLNRCVMMFPTIVVKDDIRRCWESDTLELTIEMFDGSAYRYDYLYNTIEYGESVESFNEIPVNEKEWQAQFSRRLLRTMTLKGYSQNRFAWQLDISVGALSNYVNGVRSPSAYLLIKMADLLEVPLDYLTGYKR